jgi:site-specific DNA-methyltransferase (adenine-specific)
MDDINNLNNMKQIVISGNNIETLKNYPDNYFDSIVTDPPYGLGKEPNAEEMLRAWIDTGYLEVKGVGFMGKEWDAFIPQPLFWKEIFRVLKHGGHVVSFFGTRTYDWGCMAIRLAGFEIRDCIQWVYGSGFPKSHNISKAINKMGGVEYDEIPASGVGFMKPDSEDWNVTKNQLIQKGESTEQAKQWEGWGSALKPANEPIVLARKPLEKGLSIAENVLKWGTGGLNIDVSRIGNEEREFNSKGISSGANKFVGDKNFKGQGNILVNGRFPSNFIMTHHEDCKCVGIKSIGSVKEGGYNYEGNVYDVQGFVPKNSPNANSNYGEEIVEDWDCVDDCPIKILDEQSGERKSNGKYNKDGTWMNNGDGFIRTWDVEYDKLNKYAGQTGGASRFFYVAKASQWERNYGLDGFEKQQIVGGGGLTANLREDGSLETASAGGKFGSIKALKSNIHPTVKPIKLMQYLIRLVTPPNGIVLDPFAGSGTTGIACKIDGFEFVGLELSEEYTEIANSRIQSFNEELLLLDETIIYKNRGDEENDTDSQQLTLF